MAVSPHTDTRLTVYMCLYVNVVETTTKEKVNMNRNAKNNRGARNREKMNRKSTTCIKIKYHCVVTTFHYIYCLSYTSSVRAHNRFCLLARSLAIIIICIIKPVCLTWLYHFSWEIFVCIIFGWLEWQSNGRYSRQCINIVAYPLWTKHIRLIFIHQYIPNVVSMCITKYTRSLSLYKFRKIS